MLDQNKELTVTQDGNRLYEKAKTDEQPESQSSPNETGHDESVEGESTLE